MKDIRVKFLLVLLALVSSSFADTADAYASLKPDEWPVVEEDGTLMFDYSNQPTEITQDWFTQKMTDFPDHYKDDQAKIKKWVINLASTSITELSPLNKITALTNLADITIDTSKIK